MGFINVAKGNCGNSTIGPFLLLVVRLDHFLHEGGGGGGELLAGGGAVGGGQVEEGVHLVGRR